MSALRHKRIVVTRAARQARELVALLQAREAIALCYPCIAITPPDDTAALDAALGAASQGAYQWLALTSANTVDALAERLATLCLTPTIFDRARVAAVGPATAQAVGERLGLHTEALPTHATARDLAQAIPLEPGTRVLLPHSALADSELADALTQRGAVVTAVTAYETRVGSGGVDLPRLLAASQIDAITLTSASSLTYLLQRLTTEGGDKALLATPRLACIGPSTARAARAAGLAVAVTPEEHTMPGLVAALERYYQTTGD